MSILDDIGSVELWKAFLENREQKVSFPERFRKQLEKIRLHQFPWVIYSLME